MRRIGRHGSFACQQPREIIMIRNVLAIAITAGLLAAAPALATAPFVEDDGNGGLRVVRPAPAGNVVGGAVSIVRPGVEAGSLEVVTVQPGTSQDARSVTVAPGTGAGELRLVPSAAAGSPPIGG
jgi:metal-dependent amidase/aminoacylase/carboxypeptidase family protein